jgi:hypothetical protein
VVTLDSYLEVSRMSYSMMEGGAAVIDDVHMASSEPLAGLTAAGLKVGGS